MHISGTIPLVIRPMFWVLSGLIGFLYGNTFFEIVAWVAIVLVSLLFHEYGHALAALSFGKRPRIELGMLGGLTLYDGLGLSLWKQFIIVFSGPFMGFILFLIASWSFSEAAPGAGQNLLRGLAIINIWWTAFNLLPILPLDGGQMLRIGLQAIWGSRGIVYALFAGGVLAMLISTLAFVYGFIFIAIFLMFCAFQNYEGWRQMRSVHTLDTQKRAYKEYHAGNVLTAYKMLLATRATLAPEALCLLHKVAFEVADYATVAQIAGECFQVSPRIEIALRSAEACGFLKDARSAVGWLETASSLGATDIQLVCMRTSFDPIRHDPLFEAFTRGI